MAALGLDEDNAVGATGTIEGCRILQHRHLVDILGRYRSQHIENVTLMEGYTALLHIQLHTVDNDKRLGIGIDGADASDEHGCSLLEIA